MSEYHTIEDNGESWYCHGNNFKILCRIFKDFRDTSHKCPFIDLCERIDKGNYPEFCKQ